MISTVSDDRLWIFVHIPKTAGTTFNRTVARSWFRTNAHIFQYAGFGPEEQVRRRAKLKERAGNRDVSYVSGHDVYGLGDGLQHDTQYFSFFRDPVMRLVSLWFHHRYRDGGKAIRPDWQTLFDRYGNCADFVRDTNPLAEYVYSYLTQEENWAFDKRLREILPADDFFAQSQSLVRNLAMMTLPQEAPDLYEEMSSLAFSRIDQALPLISEKFDEGLEVLGAMMGKKPVAYQRQRQSPAAKAEREEVLELLPELRAYHPEAMAFYQKQVDRFEALKLSVMA